MDVVSSGGPPGAYQSMGGPPSWNLYSYVWNNLMVPVDPAGRPAVRLAIFERKSFVWVQMEAMEAAEGSLKSGR